MTTAPQNDRVVRDLPLWQWAARDPEQPVLAARDSTETATTFLRRASQLAGLFVAYGARTVALVDTDELTTVAAAMAGTARGIDVLLSSASKDEVTRVAVRADLVLASPASAAGARTAAGDGVRVVVSADGASPAHAARFAGPVAGLVRDATSLDGPRAPALSPESAAAWQTLLPDVLGVPQGARTLVLMPHLRAFTTTLVLGLVHSRRHVDLRSRASLVEAVEAISGGAADTLVASAATLHALARRDAFRTSRLRHVVAIGRDDRLRDLIQRQSGRDPLVEYWDASGLQALRVPPASELGGFWSWSVARPADPAVLDQDGNAVTAGELRRRALDLAELLRSSSAPSVAALVSDRAVDVVTAYLAAVAAGTRLLVLSPGVPDDEMALLVTQAGATLVLSPDDAAPAMEARLRNAGMSHPVRGLSDADGAGVGDVEIERAAGAALPYTSGTSGPPKVVRHVDAATTPHAAAAWCRALARRLGIAGSGMHLAGLPLSQAAPMYFATLALHAGQAVLAMDEWEPRLAATLVAERPVTSAFMVPSMFSSLLALPSATRRQAAALRSVVHAAAACPVPVKQAMTEWWGDVLYDCYAPTELIGTYVTPDEWRARPGTVGKPFPGSDVRILDGDGALCAPGVEGLVHLRENAFEYSANARAQAVDGYATVGDLGYLDGDGWLYLTGRASEYVNIGGTKFHPLEVERVLAEVPGVADCAVTTEPHSRLGQVPVALVVAGDGVPEDDLRRAVMAHARARLVPARRPVRVVAVASLPRDAYGKLRRRLLSVPRRDASTDRC